VAVVLLGLAGLAGFDRRHKSATQSPLATGGESNWIERGRVIYRGFFQFGGS
jgi:hypothetical protein